MTKPFRLWAGGCSHISTDIQHGRESLSEAIAQSEGVGMGGGPPFDWDVMVHLGDLVGRQGTPDDEEGRLVIGQFLSSTKHTREHFYNILGNHDASGPEEATQWWFRKWIDPAGENPSTSGVRNGCRPFPVVGNWERYSFQVGNILFLMMGDRNDGGPPSGRRSRGGYPAGKVTLETFEWWMDMVENNQDKIVIAAHHHMLKDTTVASGKWEGVEGGYHGRFDDGAPQGASYLYFVGDQPDAQRFEKYLEDNPGSIDIWLGGHTHTAPDDNYGGKTHIERKWETTFINVAAMTKYHAGRKAVPMSRLLTFDPREDDVRVGCYLHTSDYAQQGWYDKVEAHVPLRHRFVGI
jgi:3',5'-cyclic AMP phosphodiesterase CpdA